MSEPERHDALLPEPARWLHRALLDGLLTTGAVPAAEALAVAAGIALVDLPTRLRELATADYAALDDTGRLTCLYPLSPSPTPHVVIIDGQRRHAMCAIDALGMAAMLGRELSIEGLCAGCGAVIRLQVRPGVVATAEPTTTVVVARRDRTEPAVSACCPFTVFACAPTDAEHLVNQTPGSRRLPLEDALLHAEALFGDLLRAPTLPASRPRGEDWVTRGG